MSEAHSPFPIDIQILDAQIPNSARELHRILKRSGYATYIVGGWVRNRIIDTKKNGSANGSTYAPKEKPGDQGDIDFATAAEPDRVMELFSHTHPTGIKHGTVTVIMGKDAYEVTTFRREGVYSDNRRPEEVAFSQTLEEDLIRRDFTVNAFAYEPETKEFVDIFDGMADLNNHILRVIHNHSEPLEIRFEEDALRMMRACRLAGQLGFVIEPKTLEAISRNAHLIDKISKERIRDEFIKTVMAPQSTVGLEYLRTTGIMKRILPEFIETYGVTQNKYHAHDVYTHSLEVLRNVNELQFQSGDRDYRLSLSGLFHDIAKPQTRTVDMKKMVDGEPHVSFYRHEILGAGIVKKVMKRLKFSTQDIHIVTHLVRNHMFHYTSEWKDGTVRRFVAQIKRENLDPLFLLRRADRLGKGEIPIAYQEDNQDLEDLQKRIQHLVGDKSFLTIADLDVDGNILMKELSLNSGPVLGYLLKQLLEQVLDNPEKNQRALLIATAKQLLEDSQQNLK